MVIGIISITLAIIAIVPCLAPGGMSAIGVFISLFALFISCFSTMRGKIKYLICVLSIATFNIFVVSEFSFALNKNLYSQTETPLRKLIYIMTYDDEERIKKEQSKKALEKYLGYKITIDVKKKEKGYWSFVQLVVLIIFIPYFIAVYRLYYVLSRKNHLI